MPRIDIANVPKRTERTWMYVRGRWKSHATPIAYQTSVVLLPGKYTIRMLVRDQASGRIGATEVPFTIPNLNRVQK